MLEWESSVSGWNWFRVGVRVFSLIRFWKFLLNFLGVVNFSWSVLLELLLSSFFVSWSYAALPLAFLDSNKLLGGCWRLLYLLFLFLTSIFSSSEVWLLGSYFSMFCTILVGMYFLSTSILMRRSLLILVVLLIAPLERGFWKAGSVDTDPWERLLSSLLFWALSTLPVGCTGRFRGGFLPYVIVFSKFNFLCIIFGGNDNILNFMCWTSLLITTGPVLGAISSGSSLGFDSVVSIMESALATESPGLSRSSSNFWVDS